MSLVKGKLKAARDAIGKKDFALAKNSAEQALAFDPTNYNANVFLGLALLELGELDESEIAYRRAIDANPEQLLAWQGLSKYYERTERWDKLAETTRRLLDIYAQTEDATKCVEAIEKLIALQRSKGTSDELIDALSLILPDSPFNGLLSTLPIPDHTNPESVPAYATQAAVHNALPILEEIVAVLERNEASAYDKEVAKRRTRLGAATPEVLRKEVGVEIWGSSRLPKFYADILNHPHTTDELRRAIDAKLLRYKHRFLSALPVTDKRKPGAAREVDELVDGAITLEIPDELAWSLCLDAIDCAEMTDYPLRLLRQYNQLFPTATLASMLAAYIQYAGLVDDDAEEQSPLAADPFDTIQDAYTSLTNSVIATRICADAYVQECDYQNAIVAAENGLSLLTRNEAERGRAFAKTRQGFKVVLATSLVHLFPPKHHVRALSVLDEVLATAPNNTACLMGRAYVLQHEDRWNEAADLFGRVGRLLPDDMNVGIRAKEEEAWCRIRVGELESGIGGLEEVLALLKQVEDAEADCARCLCRIGKGYWEMGDDKRDESYRCFISSLKHNASYAPAFSALGIYYLEAATPSDPTRASKCFQKAFELDARESDAARRLADGFAEEREWDLVEVVARRTIEGEGGLDAGLKNEGSRRFLPTNAWAWKAVGVVELARSNYAAAIQALQITLRAEPDDQVSWLRLGETYSKAGRQAAAMKALVRAQELDPDDWMCGFFLAEVQRQIGQLQEAVDAFHSIHAQHPNEVGVLVSLGESYLELGRVQLQDGFGARAERSFIIAIRVALQTMKESAGFRSLSWKTVADALFFLARRSILFEEADVRDALAAVVGLLPQNLQPSPNLRGVLPLPDVVAEPTLSPKKIIEVAAAAYDYRIALGSTESAARASAWYDLGIVLLVLSGQFTIKRPPRTSASERNTMLNERLSQPKSAQHAYIKALEVDSKNASTWANLGLLYFHQKDFELANQALLRAQTLDPECTIAWAGQALVAAANGHYSDSATLLDHAVTLVSVVPQVDLEYAARSFLRFKSKPSTHSVDDLLPMFFVLDRHCQTHPGDACGLHLFGLVCESLGQLERAAELIGKAIVVLEAEYEETESTSVEKNFTIANANIARLRLSLQDYDGAIEAFESVLGLIGEEEADDEATTMRVQAHFGISLASFFLNQSNAALEQAEMALQAAGENVLIRGHATVLSAQILWAAGSREDAKAQLLDCITKDPENFIAMNTLAAMGILTNDEGLVEAALSDLLSLPVDKCLELDPERNLDYLLTQSQLAQGNLDKALSLKQAGIFYEPRRSDTRNELAKLSLQQGDGKTAQALLSASKPEDPDSARKSLALQAITESINGNKSGAAVSLAQKALFLTPWDAQNWRSLALVRGAG
ncbi:Antiviral protein [Mycena kentingensis (nom. inval.)]|nr:Antiviral protein [Mycena kentingensis (nom. inval.)]